MADHNSGRGELRPDKSKQAATPDRKPQPNRNTRDDGRGRDASRTGSDSNPE